ncbi:Thiol-disulfide isomerase or thioredoxin [Sinomicrobium oceani]|uniref:Thiol-disulfide isomerase or thioredoxin n=2 Tax=Sinomicrobium oceani TaxID=1150368 RepID=A0A1K1MBD7_9FLAO|nr:Thiol-disulfide isomerase or thioredoxin [Sinomicrobium oceani]
MMKTRCKIIYSLLLFGMLMTGCTEKVKDGYTVKGTVAGGDNSVVKMTKYDYITRTSSVIDSTHMENGSFEFSGKTDAPDMVVLNFNNRYFANLFLENSAIEMTIDPEQKEGNMSSSVKAVVKGSVLHDTYTAITDEVASIRDEKKYKALTELGIAYNNAARNGEKEKAKKLYAELESLRDLSDEMQSRILAKKIGFLKQNHASPVAPVLLGFDFSERNLSFEEMTMIMDTLQGKATGTRMYEYFADEYEAIKRTRPGVKAPDFTLKTPENEGFSLSDIKDKYVLIDFWASWCKPCRASYPHLKELYAKYKDDGFEVLAVSTDSDHDAWNKAIEEDQTTWVHVVDTFSREGFPSDVSTLYAVPFLPTTYLLDKEGRIIAKNLHEEELDKKLEELFGK